MAKTSVALLTCNRCRTEVLERDQSGDAAGAWMTVFVEDSADKNHGAFRFDLCPQCVDPFVEHFTAFLDETQVQWAKSAAPRARD